MLAGIDNLPRKVSIMLSNALFVLFQPHTVHLITRNHARNLLLPAGDDVAIADQAIPEKYKVAARPKNTRASQKSARKGDHHL